MVWKQTTLSSGSYKLYMFTLQKSHVSPFNSSAAVTQRMNDGTSFDRYSRMNEFCLFEAIKSINLIRKPQPPFRKADISYNTV